MGDSTGLKACIFDNTGDGDFYKTSTYLAKKWPELGNPSESHFASGGHCQNIPYEDIVKCLDISGSSPTPTPTPPHPTPPPTPPTPPPSPPPSPSPSPDEPSESCKQCFRSVCPNMESSGSSGCTACVQAHQGPCTQSCVPFPF